MPHERAQFAGHHHSYTAALMGLLRYAEATNDRQVAEFVRAGYEFLRGFGIAPSACSARCARPAT